MTLQRLTACFFIYVQRCGPAVSAIRGSRVGTEGQLPARPERFQRSHRQSQPSNWNYLGMQSDLLVCRCKLNRHLRRPNFGPNGLKGILAITKSQDRCRKRLTACFFIHVQRCGPAVSAIRGSRVGTEGQLPAMPERFQRSHRQSQPSNWNYLGMQSDLFVCRCKLNRHLRRPNFSPNGLKGVLAITKSQDRCRKRLTACFFIWIQRCGQAMSAIRGSCVGTEGPPASHA